MRFKACHPTTSSSTVITRSDYLRPAPAFASMSLLPDKSAIRPLLLALAASLLLHTGLLMLTAVKALPPTDWSSTSSAPILARFVTVPDEDLRPSARARAESPARLAVPSARPLANTGKSKPATPPSPIPSKVPISMPAPPPPTAEDWALASTYTLKNSKRYRYNWGRLVRSMMGTAVEGQQQGLVRFRIEIAPDGTIARIETLWSTSKTAEALALKAIQSLPRLPPTPTGQPLVFEQTIAFEPFETGWPPDFKLDGIPDPPTFHNPFTMVAASIRNTTNENREGADPSSNRPQPASSAADTTSDSTDSVESEFANMNRQLDQWGRGQLNGVK